MRRVAGVVPCSGLSRRMGTSKALLDARGRTFVERVAGALARGGCHPVTVVVRDPAGPEARAARRVGALVLRNPDPSAGPVSSLRVALRALDERVEGVAFCPVDHPLVEPLTVEELLAAFADDDADVVLPRHGERRGHPVLFRDTVWSELLDESLEGGARTVVRRDPGRVREVAVDDPGVLADIDQPDDYRRHFPDAPRPDR